MKYQYDRKAVKKHSIKPFLNMVSDRNRVIEQAETGIPQTEFNANLLAARLHPEIQYVCVEKIVDHGDAKSFYLVPDQARGTSFSRRWKRQGSKHRHTVAVVCAGGVTPSCSPVKFLSWKMQMEEGWQI